MATEAEIPENYAETMEADNESRSRQTETTVSELKSAEFEKLPMEKLETLREKDPAEKESLMENSNLDDGKTSGTESQVEAAVEPIVVADNETPKQDETPYRSFETVSVIQTSMAESLQNDETMNGQLVEKSCEIDENHVDCTSLIEEKAATSLQKDEIEYKRSKEDLPSESGEQMLKSIEAMQDHNIEVPSVTHALIGETSNEDGINSEKLEKSIEVTDETEKSDKNESTEKEHSDTNLDVSSVSQASPETSLQRIKESQNIENLSGLVYEIDTGNESKERERETEKPTHTNLDEDKDSGSCLGEEQQTPDIVHVSETIKNEIPEEKISNQHANTLPVNPASDEETPRIDGTANKQLDKTAESVTDEQSAGTSCAGQDVLEETGEKDATSVTESMTETWLQKDEIVGLRIEKDPYMDPGEQTLEIDDSSETTQNWNLKASSLTLGSDGEGMEGDGEKLEKSLYLASEVVSPETIASNEKDEMAALKGGTSDDKSVNELYVSHVSADKIVQGNDRNSDKVEKESDMNPEENMGLGTINAIENKEAEAFTEEEITKENLHSNRLDVKQGLDETNFQEGGIEGKELEEASDLVTMEKSLESAIAIQKIEKSAGDKHDPVIMETEGMQLQKVESENEKLKEASNNASAEKSPETIEADETCMKNEEVRGVKPEKTSDLVSKLAIEDENETAVKEKTIDEKLDALPIIPALVEENIQKDEIPGNIHEKMVELEPNPEKHVSEVKEPHENLETEISEEKKNSDESIDLSVSWASAEENAAEHFKKVVEKQDLEMTSNIENEVPREESVNVMNLNSSSATQSTREICLQKEETEETENFEKAFEVVNEEEQCHNEVDDPDIEDEKSEPLAAMQPNIDESLYNRADEKTGNEKLEKTLVSEDKGLETVDETEPIKIDISEADESCDKKIGVLSKETSVEESKEKRVSAVGAGEHNIYETIKENESVENIVLEDEKPNDATGETSFLKEEEERKNREKSYELPHEQKKMDIIEASENSQKMTSKNKAASESGSEIENSVGDKLENPFSMVSEAPETASANANIEKYIIATESPLCNLEEGLQEERKEDNKLNEQTSALEARDQSAELHGANAASENEIPFDENLKSVNLSGKIETTDIKDLETLKNVDELPIIHPPVEETIQKVGKKIEKPSGEVSEEPEIAGASVTTEKCIVEKEEKPFKNIEESFQEEREGEKLKDVTAELEPNAQSIEPNAAYDATKNEIPFDKNLQLVNPSGKIETADMKELETLKNIDELSITHAPVDGTILKVGKGFEKSFDEVSEEPEIADASVTTENFIIEKEEKPVKNLEESFQEEREGEKLKEATAELEPNAQSDESHGAYYASKTEIPINENLKLVNPSGKIENADVKDLETLKTIDELPITHAPVEETILEFEKPFNEVPEKPEIAVASITTENFTLEKEDVSVKNLEISFQEEREGEKLKEATAELEPNAQPDEPNGAYDATKNGVPNKEHLETIEPSGKIETTDMKDLETLNKTIDELSITHAPVGETIKEVGEELEKPSDMVSGEPKITGATIITEKEEEPVKNIEEIFQEEREGGEKFKDTTAELEPNSPSDEPKGAYDAPKDGIPNEENIRTVDPSGKIKAMDMKDLENLNKHIDELTVTHAPVEETIHEEVSEMSEEASEFATEGESHELINVDSNIQFDIPKGNTETEKLERRSSKSETADHSDETVADISRDDEIPEEMVDALTTSQVSVQENTQGEGALPPETDHHIYEEIEASESTRSTTLKVEKTTDGETPDKMVDSLPTSQVSVQENTPGEGAIPPETDHRMHEEIEESESTIIATLKEEKTTDGKTSGLYLQEINVVGENFENATELIPKEKLKNTTAREDKEEEMLKQEETSVTGLHKDKEECEGHEKPTIVMFEELETARSGENIEKQIIKGEAVVKDLKKISFGDKTVEQCFLEDEKNMKIEEAVPELEVKENALVSTGQSFEATGGNEKIETMTLIKNEKEPIKNLDGAPVKDASIDKSLQEVAETLEETYIYVHEEQIHKPINADEKNTSTDSASVHEAISSSDITDDSNKKDEDISNKKSDVSPITDASRDEILKKDCGGKLAEASILESEEQMYEKIDANEIMVGEEEVTLLNKKREMEHPTEEVGYETIDIETSKNEENLQKPIRQASIEETLQKNDEKLEKASDLLSEDKIQQKIAENEREETSIPQSEETPEIISLEHATTERSIPEDEIEGPKKIENTSDLVLEELTDENIDARDDAEVIIAKDEENPHKNLGDSSVITASDEDDKIGVAELVSKAQIHKTIISKDSLEQVSEEMSIPEDKVDIGKLVNDPDLVSHEKIQESEKTESTSPKDDKSLNKIVDVLYVSQVSDGYITQKEEETPTMLDSTESTQAKSSIDNKHTLSNPQDAIEKTLQKENSKNQKLEQAVEVESKVPGAKYEEENQDTITEEQIVNVAEGSIEESNLPHSNKVRLSDLLAKSKKESLQSSGIIMEEKNPPVSEDELQNKQGTAVQVEEVKTDEDKDEDDDDDDDDDDENKKEESGSDAPVMVEASRDVDLKPVQKKSHNILSGVGSKVKHSIAKVKKAITGKSSHTKQPSPK